ncbi:MAG: type VI secretion system tip protein TssI/VgrG [Polyangiaceae bacterium]
MSGQQVELGCAVLGSCEVVRLRGREAMNELPEWEIEAILADAPSDLDALLGAPALLRLFDPAEAAERAVELVVCEARDLGAERVGHRIAIVLSPLARLAEERAGYRVFLDRATHQIVEEVVKDAGIAADRFELRLASEYAPRSQCTQYAESDWQFVSRLLAEEGQSYWFDDGDDGTKLILGDSMGSHDGIPPPVTLRFEDPGGMSRARSFHALERTEEVTPDKVHLRDFDVRNPDVYLEAKEGDGDLSWFEYPSFAPTAASSKVRAKARLEQLQRFSTHLRGETDCTRLRPGRLLKIDGADAEMNGEHLIVAVEHAYERANPNDAQAKPYSNVVTMVPGGEMAFRPAVSSQRPRLQHVDSAITTGPSGEEIHVDDLGRLKLRFFWDPSGKTDDKTSAWARGAQWQLTGAMALPRVGWEVPVMYMDGSPDRPFVLGRAYNGQRVPPYSLPASKAVSAIRTDTTPYDGSMQEIKLTDDAGGQQFRVQASRDQSVFVGGSSKTTVATTETHDIGGALSQIVQAAQSIDISGSQKVGVGTQAAKKVGGAITHTVGAMQRTGVGGNRSVQAGGFYGEFIGAAYLLQCNQSNARFTGGFAQINGITNVLSGLGHAEHVAGARGEIVGGAVDYLIGGTYKDEVIGPKSITAGAASETAGAGIATKASLGKITAGTASATAGTKITVSATTITINAGTLTAGALTMSGAVQITAGSLQMRAPVVTYSAGASVGS